MLPGLIAAIQKVVNDLRADYTTARAGKLDNIDATTSSRAAASTALSSATWTGAKAGYIDAAISGRLGSIKSIQTATGSFSLPGAGNTNGQTITITSVATAKTILIPLGAYSGGAGAASARFALTNATTITWDASGPASQTVTVACLVVEFN